MNDTDLLVDKVIAQALDEIVRKGMSGQIVTVALYFDHEGPALSICADTLDNSDRHAATSLSWSFHQMAAALEAGDLENAELYNASVGRSLSLGDFSLVNLGRTELPSAERCEPDEAFFRFACVGATPQHDYMLRSLRS